MTCPTPASSTPDSPLRLPVVVGAGYIGSPMVTHRLRRGCDVVTFDNLSTRHRVAVLGGEFVLGNMADGDALDAMFAHGVQRIFFSTIATVYGEPAHIPSRSHTTNCRSTPTAGSSGWSSRSPKIAAAPTD